MRRLKPTYAERSLLAALVLTCPGRLIYAYISDFAVSSYCINLTVSVHSTDRPNLFGKGKVREVRSALIEIEKVYGMLRSDGSQGKQRSLMPVASLVHDAGKEHAQLVNGFRSHPEKLTVSPVICELFDLHPLQKYKEK